MVCDLSVFFSASGFSLAGNTRSVTTADAVFLTDDVLDRKPIQVKALRGGRGTVCTEYDAMGSIQTAGNRLPQC